MKKNSTTVATFVYDGDGKRVKSTIAGTTIIFVGNHYEVSGETITKYYFAGATRVAMRIGSSLRYLLSDHLGSTSIVTNSVGTVVSENRYKAWGEVRYTSGTTPTKYTYTGQYTYTSDFGLMYYNARWYDPALGRFAQADPMVQNPYYSTSYDRYSYVYNNPVKYIDPTGYFTEDEIKDYLKHTYGDVWEQYLKAWQSDDIFWQMLLHAELGDYLGAPTTLLGLGHFYACEGQAFCFESENGYGLEAYQGKGPYTLIRNGILEDTGSTPYTGGEVYTPGTGAPPYWAQPQYDYSSGIPVYTGFWRVVTYGDPKSDPTWHGGDALPYCATACPGIVAMFISAPAGPIISGFFFGVSYYSWLNHTLFRLEWSLTTSYISGPQFPPVPVFPIPFNPFKDFPWYP
jgi:RHS repeat-associated protein